MLVLLSLTGDALLGLNGDVPSTGACKRMETDDQDALVVMLLAGGVRNNPSLGVRMFKDRDLRLEAAVRVPQTRSMPPFVACRSWTHPFSDDGAEVEVRWVFDRRTWKLASSSVRASGDGDWRPCNMDEARDLEESLVLANGEILVDVSVWDDCFECDRIPV